MSGKLHQHIRHNVVGYVALFLVLCGGTAYATHPGGADTISTGDIINGEVRAADIGNNAVNTLEIADDAVRTQEILDSEVKSADIRNGDVRSADVLDNSLTGTDIAPDSLGTTQVNEGNLNVVEGSSGLQMFTGREQLTGAEAGPSSVIFAPGIANVNAEKNAADDCTMSFLNPPTNGSTYTVVIVIQFGSTSSGISDITLAPGDIDSIGPFATTGHIHWDAWEAGDPSDTARVISVDAALRPSGTTCDFSATMTVAN